MDTSAAESADVDSLGRRTGPRRQHTIEEKLRIVLETHVRGASVATVAHRHKVNPNQVFAWRQLYRRGLNWLFAGSDDGGERAAAIYSLLGTAKLNNLDPEGYLRYVLERIADHPINRLEELLPWTVVEQLPSLRLAA